MEKAGMKPKWQGKLGDRSSEGVNSFPNFQLILGR
jgi:hypothetical protein